MLQTGCAFINSEHTECGALSELVCKKKDCKFFKKPEQYDRKKVEREITHYSSRAALKD